MTRIAELADWPATAQDATAARLARAYAIYARHNLTAALTPGIPARDAARAEQGASYQYAISLLLGTLAGARVHGADEIARHLWDAMGEGEVLAEALEEHLRTLGVDPDAVARASGLDAP